MEGGDLTIMKHIRKVWILLVDWGPYYDCIC